MKCPECRAEIISNTVKTCPYCGSSLITSEKNKKAEHVTNDQTREIAARIREAIDAQKAFNKSEKEVTKKMQKKLEEVVKKKYTTIDIVILLVSLTLSFIVLALTLSLLLRR